MMVTLAFNELMLVLLHGFDLLELLPVFLEISSFVCNKRLNLLSVRPNSETLIVAKGS